jgi:hypothetical protein
MKRLLLSVVVIVLMVAALPAFSTISQVRSAATWNSSASSTCLVSLSATNSTDLLVLWTYWRTSGTNNLTVSSITHTLGTSFSNAVGPTVQSASDTAAEIFYIPKL